MAENVTEAEEKAAAEAAERAAEEAVEKAAEEDAEKAAEIASEVAAEVAAVVDPTPDVEVTVIEAPEPEEPETVFSTVDVGDLHLSGPSKMVQAITEGYLKKHLDHNPHEESHADDGNLLDTGAAAVTPDVVEEQIVESAAAAIVDDPPEPSDWLFRRRAGR